MGKKTQGYLTTQKVLTMKEHLRHSSVALQRHIFHRNRESIKEFIDQKIKNHQISFQTHDKYMDLLRETKKESEIRSQLPENSDTSDKDSEEERKQIHKDQSLQNQFEVMLDKTEGSYQKTYHLFKRLSLLQKYGHLVGLQQQEQQKLDVQELTEQEERALKKIKILYRRYKVSNMYKTNVSSRIRKLHIEKLIQKGYLREKNQIISLTT